MMKFDDIRELADQGYTTGPAGSFGPGGFIVNCPVQRSDIMQQGLSARALPVGVGEAVPAAGDAV